MVEIVKISDTVCLLVPFCENDVDLCSLVSNSAATSSGRSEKPITSVSLHMNISLLNLPELSRLVLLFDDPRRKAGMELVNSLLRALESNTLPSSGTRPEPFI